MSFKISVHFFYLESILIRVLGAMETPERTGADIGLYVGLIPKHLFGNEKFPLSFNSN